MDKYLEEVRSYLTVLEENAVNKEIDNIKKYLDKSLEEGKKFEELNLVSAKEQASEILKSYGLNPEVVLKEEKFFKRKINELVKGFNHLLDTMSKNELKANLKIILDFIILLIFISLVKIPFIAVRNIGESLLQNIDFPLAFNIWGLAIELVYIIITTIIAIMIFINVFPRWLNNLKPINRKVVVTKEKPIEDKKMGNDLESISLTDNKENK